MRTILLAAAALAALVPAASAAPHRSAAAAPEAIAAAQPGPADWRTPDPNDVLVIDTSKGRIFVEMVPEVAPQTVQRMRELAHANFFDGLKFFRVVEKFMDQTGDPQNTGSGGSDKPNVPGEFTFRRGADTPFIMVADQTVDEIGFVKTVPVMTQSMMLAPMTKDQKVTGWALFCPGIAGFARDDNPDSGNSQFFLMRAGYPSLEKRYTAWGRVIAGQDVVTAIKVGEPPTEPMDRMERVRLLADLPEAQRPKVRVIDPKSPWFRGAIDRMRRARGADFSACDVEIPSEVR
ncbi:MAG: peptidylprolyl isomerase [Phenylobacterium sp.]|nr:MAG: peptidylprolyl isomerase [Phenylobacterium sp.]